MEADLRGCEGHTRKYAPTVSLFVCEGLEVCSVWGREDMVHLTAWFLHHTEWTTHVYKPYGLVFTLVYPPSEYSITPFYLLDRLIISLVVYQPVNIAMGTPEGAYVH